MPDADEFSTWLARVPHDWIGGCGVSAFERARAAYASPLRQYHTWAHVESCVAEISSFACEHPRSIFLALVFHDAVYVAGRSDNEAKSAELARRVLEADGCVSAPELHAIDRMIRATSDHLAHADTTDRDLSILLDIDLGILGASREVYARYARAIHDEYVPSASTDAQFRIGRLAFLERTLASARLFITREASQRWDARARENIAWEIQQLKGEQGLVERGASTLRPH